jgi:hypothetical protein
LTTLSMDTACMTADSAAIRIFPIGFSPAVMDYDDSFKGAKTSA